MSSNGYNPLTYVLGARAGGEDPPGGLTGPENEASREVRPATGRRPDLEGTPGFRTGLSAVTDVRAGSIGEFPAKRAALIADQGGPQSSVCGPPRNGRLNALDLGGSSAGPTNPLDFPPTFGPGSLVRHGAETCPGKQMFYGTPISWSEVCDETPISWSGRGPSAPRTRLRDQGKGTRWASSSSQFSTTTIRVGVDASSVVPLCVIIRKRSPFGAIS